MIDGEIRELIKIANTLDSVGLYREAQQIDVIIKEAGFWSDLYKKNIFPIVNYIKNWGTTKFDDYLKNNPNSWLTNLVKRVMNRTDIPTGKEVDDFVTQSYGKAQQEEAGEKTERKPDIKIPKEEEVKPSPGFYDKRGIYDAIGTAISQNSSIRIIYTRDYDGGTYTYDVRPDQVRKVEGNKFWAFHNDKIHSFIVDNISYARVHKTAS